MIELNPSAQQTVGELLHYNINRLPFGRLILSTPDDRSIRAMSRSCMKKGHVRGVAHTPFLTL